MSVVRIGFVGLGGICRERHVPGFRRIPGVELVVVANRSRESGERAARACGIPEVAENWSDVVAREDLDAVVIGTWPYMHHPVSIAALQNGKHVFCQARMAMNAREAEEMKQAADTFGRVAMLCPVPIGLSVDATVRRLLREDALGEVRLVRVQGFSDTFATSEAPMNWRKDHRFSGLNALTLGMYVEVVHRWFGWTRSVSAATQIFVPERTDGLGRRTRVKIPDQFLLHTSTQAGVPVQYCLSGAVSSGRDSIEVYGSEHALSYDVGDDTLHWLAGGRPGDLVDIRPEESYDVKHWRVEQDFIDAIRGGRAYHPDFEDGRRYMQVVQAVYESAAHERTVHLED